MNIIIKHKNRGRIRVQLAQSRMSPEQADLLECYLQGLPQVLHATVHERTRCAIVVYRGPQAELLRAFQRFSYQMETLHPPLSSRALNRTYEEKLVGMVAAIRCNQNAFRYFGGYPEEILYDNMKQVVIKRLLKQEDSTLNRQFEDFAGFYGFKPILCRPYRGQTKGKVDERTESYDQAPLYSSLQRAGG